MLYKIDHWCAQRLSKLVWQVPYLVPLQWSVFSLMQQPHRPFPSPVCPDLAKFRHFGKILSLWECFWGFVYNWGKNRSKFSNFLCSWANFHCLKWPNIEQMLLPSGHTVSNSKQRTYKSLKALKLENLLQPFQRVLSFKMELRPSKSSKKNLRLSLKIMEHTYFLSVPRYLPIVSIYLLSLCT